MTEKSKRSSMKLKLQKREDEKAKRELTRLKTKAESDEVFRVVLMHIEDNHKKSLKMPDFQNQIQRH